MCTNTFARFPRGVFAELEVFLYIHYNRNMILTRLKWVMKLALLLFCSAWLSAQRYFIRNYQQAHGLPTLLVNCGLRTPDGYAWFGTPGGLIRFDGSAFQTIRIEEGLINNGIRCLLSQGRDLWIGTAAGVNRYDGQRFTVPEGLPKSMVTAMAGRGKEIWVATVDGGLYAGQGNTFRLLFRDDGDGPVTDLEEFSGKTWALFSKPRRKAARSWTGSGWEDVPSRAPGLRPRFLVVWSEKLWMGTDRGLIRVDGDADETLLEGMALNSAWADRGGRLWIGTEKGGVKVLGQGFTRHLSVETGLVDNHIQAVFGDDEGLIWVCTSRGLSKVTSLAFRGYFDDLPVMAVAEYDDALWFATDEEGVVRRESGNSSFRRLGEAEGLPTLNVRALAVFQGHLYAGTRMGLRRWNGSRFVRTKLDFLNDEYVLNLQTVQDRLWISTVRLGLVAYDRRQASRYDTGCGLPSNTVWSVALQGENVWIATEGGLCRMNPQGQVQRLGRADGLSCDQIRGLLYDPSAQCLWVATGNGLDRYCEGEWRRYGRGEGLTSPHVSSLLPVGGELWLGTERGIYILSQGRIRRGPGRNSGLFLGEECSGVSGLFRGRDGVVWFLSTSGATEIDTERLHREARPLPLRITRVISGEESLSLPLSRPLPRRQNHLTFSYRALTMAAEGEILYRTRLDGVDENWSEATPAESVRYANLGGGGYRLRVQAKAEPEMPWSPETSLDFTITPALIEREWVIALLVVFFAGMSYYLVLAVKKLLGAISFFRRVRYIGHFKILDHLGTGGMGVVYKAQDQLNANRVVALKVLRKEQFDSDSGKRRFQLEGSIVDQFDHPGIVRNLERGEIEGSLYIAMEYVDGLPLNELLRQQGPLPVSLAVQLMMQILDVLDHLHEKGVLHRDLKPENLMISRGDPPQVKLLDFGLALRETQTRLTQSGMVMGTLYFLPPERIQAGESTAKGDVYGAGILFFEMVTGRRPFEEDGFFEVMKAILDSELPSPVAFRSDLPPKLAELIQSMMNRDPNQRPSAREALRLLQEILPEVSEA